MGCFLLKYRALLGTWTSQEFLLSYSRVYLKGIYQFLCIALDTDELCWEHEVRPKRLPYSVLRPTCFSPATDPSMWEGITPEQWSRAEQGQNCTQRHHSFFHCNIPDLWRKGANTLLRGWKHSASDSRAMP